MPDDPILPATGTVVSGEGMDLGDEDLGSGDPLPIVQDVQIVGREDSTSTPTRVRTSGARLMTSSANIVTGQLPAVGGLLTSGTYGAGEILFDAVQVDVAGGFDEGTLLEVVNLTLLDAMAVADDVKVRSWSDVTGIGSPPIGNAGDPLDWPASPAVFGIGDERTLSEDTIAIQSPPGGSGKRWSLPISADAPLLVKQGDWLIFTTGATAGAYPDPSGEVSFVSIVLGAIVAGHLP